VAAIVVATTPAHVLRPLLCLSILAVQQSNAFAVAAMRELQAIYHAKGERQLEANLQRHIALAEAREAQKKAGKAHGSTAWTQLFGQVQEPDQQGLVRAARQRKVQLGLIRPVQHSQQEVWQLAQQQQQQGQGQGQGQAGQQPRHSKQQQQQQQRGDGAASGIPGFDFAAAANAVLEEAAAAAQQQARGRRRRQNLQQ